MKKNPIGIFYYPSSNVKSLTNALDMLNTDYKVSSDLEDFKNLKKIIIPGVGNMKVLIENKKFAKIKTNLFKLKNSNKLIYGICLGYQLFFGYNEEAKKNCLNFLKGTVKNNCKTLKKKLNVGYYLLNKPNLNNIFLKKIFHKINLREEKFYFLHSYSAILPKKFNKGLSAVYSHVDGKKVLSMVMHNNILGTQFHPELSKNTGLKFLKNFTEI